MTTKLKPGSYDCLGFKAADVLRTSGLPQPVAGSADYHLESRGDRELLVRQSQQFARDNGLYVGVLNRAIDNIIGDGFSLQARTTDETLNEQLEGLWNAERDCLEVRDLFAWWQLERLVLRSLWTDGDVGAIKTNTGKIQVVESARITRSKRGTLDNGVELDGVGKPLAFHVADYDTSGRLKTGSATRIAAENFIFVAYLERAGQTRGMPAQVSNFPMFHRINDICDSEAVAWQLLSRLALTMSYDGAQENANQLSADNPERTGASAEQLDARIQDFDYGMIVHAPTGAQIKGIDRNLPGANFPNSITMFVRLLGLPLGLPLELILLDWSKTNYSSARAALEQAFRMFGCWQRLLKLRWHAPIYRWKVQQWIDNRQITVPAGVDPFAHEWISPSFPWIDQLKEAEAWGARIDRGLSTQAEAQKSVNRDHAEWLRARSDEVRKAILQADELNVEFPGAKVPWQMFAGIQVSGTASSGAAQPAPADKTVQPTREDDQAPSQPDGADKPEPDEDDQESDENEA
jgi:lambda family phage portal protein